MTFKNKKAKSQSKLFHAIENGNFDDLDLPTGSSIVHQSVIIH